MNTRLQRLSWPLLGLAAAFAVHAAVAAKEEGRAPAASVDFDGRAVRIAATDTPGELRVTHAGEKQGIVARLPEGAGPIVDVKASAWMSSGLAAVVRTRPSAGGAAYFWVTLRGADPSAKVGAERFETPVVGTVFEKAEALDVVGLVNPGGDTLYAVLARHSRETGLASEGYLWLHVCPVDPKIPGQLFRLSAQPAAPR